MAWMRCCCCCAAGTTCRAGITRSIRTARSIDTCSQKLRGTLARKQTARAHADLAALRDEGDIDIAAMSRVLQELRETVRRLRGDVALAGA
ncbi:hypothetical protein [Limimaricola cinnabarinus]|uniref:hypothetical protein n=1 Tax=Limimaricola cinnabarinus TaxID=1125964 RepID=UPI002FE078F6